MVKTRSQILETQSRRHELQMKKEVVRDSYIDIIVVGAGLAGATAALVLDKQGWRVTLIDPRATCPPVFKAEKIEPDQVRMLRKFGLLDLLLPCASRIRAIHACYNGRLFGISQTEQYGTYYSDMVNTLRSHLPASALFKLGRVVEIRNGPEFQKVKLGGGEELTCRLVVLACGLNADLFASLGLTRSSVQTKQSIALEFTLPPVNRQL